MDAGLRVFGEVKPPKNMERARQEMRNYLNSDLEVDAVTVLTDGFNWELWVRPGGQSVDEDEDPYAEASLRDPLQATTARNMEVDTARAFDIRDRIDTDAFSSFTTDSLREIVKTELDCPISF
jgi:hypothetical protein